LQHCITKTAGSQGPPFSGKPPPDMKIFNVIVETLNYFLKKGEKINKKRVKP
jgi:hypothetical protein